MSAILQSLRTLTPVQRKAFAAVMARKGVDLFRDVAAFKVDRAAGRDIDLPVSHGQQRLWFLQQMDPEGAAYAIPGVFRLTGPLDAGALETALTALAGRHEALRTVFPVVDGQPVQRVLATSPVRLARWDLSGLPADERQARLEALCGAEAAAPFDLARGPLLRGGLVRLAGDEHALLLTLHHIVADGRSVDLLMAELAVLYPAAVRGEVAALPALPVQYADFALWQRYRLECGEEERQLAWWKDRLGADHAPLELPADRPRPPVRSGEGGSVRLELPAAPAARLRDLADARRVTVFTVLLAAFLALLHRHGGRSDLRVGVPMAGRGRVELEPVVGLFINTVVIGAALDGRLRFQDLLAQVHEAALTAQDRQDLPFDRLVEALQPERNGSHTPLFQVLFNHLRPGLTGIRRLGDIRIEAVGRERAAQKFDLTLTTEETEGGGLAASFGYAADIFDRAGVEALARRYQLILQQVAGHPARAIGDLDLLDAGERRRLLEDWARPEPPGDTPGVLELIAEQAVQAPDGIAVEQDGWSLSNAELDRRSNRLARRLMAAGAGPGRTVALLCGRRPELVVGLLAVLKTGGAYVPLEPATPEGRLGGILRSSGACLLLTAGLVPGGFGIPTLPLEDDPAGDDLTNDGRPIGIAIHPRQPAYVIFTSGSTGQPKGVAVPHAALAAYVAGLLRRLRLAPGGSMAMASTVAADLGHTVLFGALCSGRTLHLLGEDAARDPLLFADTMSGQGVGVLKIAPSHLESLLIPGREAEGMPARALILGGEPCGADLLARLRAARPDCRLINHYGPTETTVGVLTEEVGALPAAPARIPLGRPLPQAVAYALDRDLNPLPAGVAGELYVGGPALADGYLGKPGQTAERFVPDPFGGGGGRLYRTGDLVRWRADGRLDFLGRIDQQVKIRGFRVEPGEVEAVLRAQPGVRQAAVLARPGRGGAELAAYLVTEPDSDRDAILARVRVALRAQLPDHMQPSFLVPLAALPLTANGKLDRKALPEPERPAARAVTPPRTDTERLVAGVWREVLGVEAIGLEDNFFELGGHSLSATQAVSRLRQTALSLPLRSLFEARRLEDFAEAVEACRKEGAPTPVAALEPSAGDRPQPLSHAQERLWFFGQLEPDTAIYNIPGALRLTGPLDRPALGHALSQLVERHAALRTRFIQQDGQQDGEPMQLVVPAAAVALEVTELGHLPAAAREAALRQLAEAEAARPFDLSQAPLLRAGLVRLGMGEHVLLVTLHHIAADGWSIRLLVGELGALYAAALAGLPARLPPLALRYGDFAQWQRRLLEAGEMDRQLGYWRRHLGTEHPVLELPADRPRAMAGRAGAHHEGMIDAALTARLRAFAGRRNLTPFMLLLAAFAVVLHERTGQARLRVGGDIANRNHDRLEGLVGFFVNQLVLQVDIDPGMGVAALLDQCRRVVVEGTEHQDLPFNRLVEALRPPRREGRSPFFSVKLIYQDGVHAMPDLPGLTVEPFPAGSHAAEIDLVVAFNNAPDTLQARLTCPEGLFEPSSLQALLDQMAAVLDAMITTPEADTARLTAAAAVVRQARSHAQDTHHAAQRRDALDRQHPLRRAARGGAGARNSLQPAS